MPARHTHVGLLNESANREILGVGIIGLVKKRNGNQGTLYICNIMLQQLTCGCTFLAFLVPEKFRLLSGDGDGSLEMTIVTH